MKKIIILAAIVFFCISAYGNDDLDALYAQGELFYNVYKTQKSSNSRFETLKKLWNVSIAFQDKSIVFDKKVQHRLINAKKWEMICVEEFEEHIQTAIHIHRFPRVNNCETLEKALNVHFIFSNASWKPTRGIFYKGIEINDELQKTLNSGVHTIFISFTKDAEKAIEKFLVEDINAACKTAMAVVLAAGTDPTRLTPYGKKQVKEVAKHFYKEIDIIKNTYSTFISKKLIKHISSYEKMVKNRLEVIE